MITVSSSINVTVKLNKGVITNYGTNIVSLFIKCNGIQKRFDASSVTNSTVGTDGSVVFSNVPLWQDGSYSVYVTAESSSDLDVNGVMLVTLATGYIKKITNESTLVL